ncbi:uncharacterized protein LOC117640434 [Thrips palmi]|uniref:Uncharacterized protein LOC117640434 n=1 Tax=Thrips palmi TaxID=161013 RepID=A0A6P8ZI18_THRPL|nr:uncharacterized protein LOC117640434 [Thrips palmi]
MVTCCIIGCSSRSGRDNVKFYQIPKVLSHCDKTSEVTTRRRLLWFSRIHRANITEATVTKSTQVCSLHFVDGKPAYHMDEQNPDWAPSLNLGHNNLALPDCARYLRIQNRRPLAPLNQNIQVQENLCEDVEMNEHVNDRPGFCSIECQTDLSMLDIQAMEEKLEKAGPPVFSEKHLQSDKKCKFYTGIPTFAILILIFDLIAPHIKKNYNSSQVVTTKFQEFAAVLARLRLGLLEEDIADRLRVTQGTVSKFFNMWIPVMAQCLSGLIVWPDRVTLRKTMPQCFQDQFGKSVAVVVDCFEVFCETPSGLLAKAQIYSQYKHHSTVKFLLGITPQGTISYISKAFGGRSSDQFITVNCQDFLNNLLPGDVVLADRGFDVNECVGRMQARVVTPSFMHGRNQLSAEDVEVSRRIAHVRIHVERVISLLRNKYLVLKQTLNFDYLQQYSNEPVARIDDVVLVCCALCNLSSPIIPMSDSPED